MNVRTTNWRWSLKTSEYKEWKWKC